MDESARTYGSVFVPPHLQRPQGKCDEAARRLERALSICLKKPGDNQDLTVDTQVNLERVRKRIAEQETK